MVVIHTDLTQDAKRCFSALVGRNLSTHFMVDYDGTIYQGLDPGYEAFHGGSVNSVSIGIDMNNLMRNLRSEPQAPMHADSTMEGWGAVEKRKYNRPRAKAPMRINGGLVDAYGYTDPQYQALIQLLTRLSESDLFKRIQRTFPFDAKGDIIPNVVEGGESFEGIVGHWHVSATRWDPGPAFDWQRVYAGLVRENNSFPIVLSDGKTIANLLERDKVEQQAELYYKLNEMGLENEPGSVEPEGGWFPVGPNQTWHGGIHLSAKAGKEVVAMFNGVLVAARFHARPTRLGSNNFILLRHAIEIPQRDKKKKRELIFWTLYMHMAPIDWDAKEGLPEWYGKLLKKDAGAIEEAEAAMAGAADEDEDEEPKDKKKKKKKGKKDKKAPDEEALDDAANDEDEDDDLDDDGELQRISRLTMRVGPGLRALKDGSIAWFEWEENPIEISSSEPIGQVGEFGKPDEWTGQLHVEVFADDRWEQGIDMATHGQFFTPIVQLPRDDRSLFVKNRGVLNAFDASSRARGLGSLVPERVLERDDIYDLYTSSDQGARSIKRRLRKAVVKSVSEWSDQVDWVTALSEAQAWNEKVRDFRKVIKESGIFRAALEQVLPFVWLTQTVAEKVGIQGAGEAWTGRVWHFHPVHFLMWLTYHSSRRVQKLSRSVSPKKLKELKKQAEAEAEKALTVGASETNRERGLDYGAVLDDLDVESVSIDEVLNEWFDEDADQGDWREVRDGLD
jgi:N-acetyl-anhydromuramyl-L-alanine amidase AmpD